MSAPTSDPPQDALASLRIDRSREDQARGRGPWKWLIWLSALLVGGTAIGGGVWYAAQAGWIQPAAIGMPDVLQSKLEVRIETVSVRKGRSGDATVVATGYLESRRQAMIGARVPGRIQVIHVEEGSRVKADSIMAILEHADLDAGLAAAQATHNRALAEKTEQEVEIARTRRNFERVERLRQTNSVAEEEYDQARFQYEAAQARIKSLTAAIELAAARVREAQQLKENMFIRAPFDGTVISKNAEVGESILPGGMGEASGRGSVVTVADLEHLEVECDVKEDYISRIRSDQPTEVAVDAVPDRRYKGRVRKIIPMGDRARATIKVQVEIVNADKRLFPEMSATVYFLPAQVDQAAEDENRRRIFCPAAAVVQNPAGESIVWVVDDEDRVASRPVTAGETRDDQTEITAGLDGGERVVVQPPEELTVGQVVKAR